MCEYLKNVNDDDEEDDNVQSVWATLPKLT